MSKSRQSLQTLVLAALLLFAQWASASHAVEIYEEAHFHSVDCSICVFDGYESSAASQVDVRPDIGAPAALPRKACSLATPAYSFRAIRAPPQ